MNVLDQYIGDGYALYHGDACEVLKGLPDASVHLSVYSPPFANLYIYSDSVRDAGNSADDEEFFDHYRFLIADLHRVTVPGRLSAVHCKQLVNYKGRDGMAGLRDFRGEIIRAHVAAGWAYHSEVCIWKDPVIEMQRTKAHGLLYKQLRADASFSRQGMAEYLVIFRRWPHSESEESKIEPVTHTREGFQLEIWQRWASPVWMDIRQTRVLNVQAARDDRDSKHICPLQLDVIERAIELWTNPGDVVLDPFNGIGSSTSVAIQMKRCAIGVELKDSYHEQACRNMAAAVAQSGQGALFDVGETESRVG